MIRYFFAYRSLRISDWPRSEAQNFAQNMYRPNYSPFYYGAGINL